MSAPPRDLLIGLAALYLFIELGHRTVGQPIGRVTRILLPFSILPMLFVGKGDHHWTTDVLLVVAQILCSAVVGTVWVAENARDQIRRDRRAQTLREEIGRLGSADTPPRFALYLRPFDTTDRLGTQIQHGGSALSEGAPHIDLETVITQAVARNAPLVALGRPGEMTGAGRIASSEQAWREDFATLARAAALIVMVPSANPGTFWEAEWLRRERYLEKCIFVMPELLSDSAVNHAVGWNQARDRWGKIGIRLPEYTKNGMLFTVDNDGLVRRSLTLNLSGTLFRVQRIRRAVATLAGAEGSR